MKRIITFIAVAMSLVAAGQTNVATRSKQASQAWVEMKLEQLEATMLSALDGFTENATNEQSISQAAADFANYTIGEISAIQDATFFATSYPTSYYYEVVATGGDDVPLVGSAADFGNKVMIDGTEYLDLGATWYINSDNIVRADYNNDTAADGTGGWWSIARSLSTAKSGNAVYRAQDGSYVVVVKKYRGE